MARLHGQAGSCAVGQGTLQSRDAHEVSGTDRPSPYPSGWGILLAFQFADAESVLTLAVDPA